MSVANIADSIAAGSEGLAEGLAELFAQVFHLPAASVEDDFFKLGGDSLTGTTLMTAIEGRYGVSLSLSILLEAPTPKALANVIAERQRPGAAGGRGTRDLPAHLTAVNRDGRLPPLFLVHGNTGESIAPHRLSRVFNERVFYAFRALGHEQGEDFMNTMDAFASDYLSVIRQLYPEGGLVIMGHCAGATIAYEMAQRLAAEGRGSVALVMIDPETDPEPAPHLTHSGLELVMRQTSWRKRVADMNLAEQTNPALRLDRRREYVIACVKAAIGPYSPERYSGPALLLYTDERRDVLLNPKRGYPAHMPNLETVRLSVGHLEMFTSGAAEVGAAVESFLQRVLPGS